MTKTNRAFIKAYRHDGAQAAPASPPAPVGGAQRPAAAAAEAKLPIAATASAERSALYGPRHVRTAPNNQAAGPTAGAAAEKRPLSSFLARPLESPPGGRSSDTDFLRPGTTVASFQWPPVCRALTQQCGSALDRLAQLVATEAKSGRALVAVVGLRAGCGATTVALCLAARLAARRTRVILVEGNFRRPTLASWLEAVPNSGWQDVLRHGGPLADAVVRATDDGIDMLALDERPSDNAQSLVGGLQAVVTAGVLRHAYDVVLIDAGAFFEAASQPIVLELVRNMGVDAVLAVRGEQPADARDLQNLASHLSRSGCELLGTIENRTAASRMTAS